MADLTRPPDVGELATVAEASPSAFGHRFRRLVGSSPVHYVTRVRLEAVRRLLETGDEPLAAIAARCGFADANHERAQPVRRRGRPPKLR